MIAVTWRGFDLGKSARDRRESRGEVFPARGGMGAFRSWYNCDESCKTPRKWRAPLGRIATGDGE